MKNNAPFLTAPPPPLPHHFVFWPTDSHLLAIHYCTRQQFPNSFSNVLLQIPASEKAKTVELFTTRRNQYRIAALTCKKNGDLQQAKQFLAVSKVRR